MCGRFALGLERSEIRRVPGHDGVDAHEWINEDSFVPRFNISPRTYAPVLYHAIGGGYMLHTMKWGLVPSWSMREDYNFNTINARSENLVSQGGMWGKIKGRRRCAVLAQGYYEWLNHNQERLPHFTKHRDGILMLMAGLYDMVILKGQKEPLWTFTIVTTAANKDSKWLHHRQPVILSTRAALDAWLDTSSQTWTPALSKLVQPFSDSTHPLECYQVPNEVSKVGSESPLFIEPISSPQKEIEGTLLMAPAAIPHPQYNANLIPDAIVEASFHSPEPPSGQHLKPEIQAQTPTVEGLRVEFKQLITHFNRFSSQVHKPVDYLQAICGHLSDCISHLKLENIIPQTRWTQDLSSSSILFPHLILYIYSVIDAAQLAEFQVHVITWEELDILPALCKYGEIANQLRSFVHRLATSGNNMDNVQAIVALDLDRICARLYGLVKDDVIQYRRLVNLKGAEATSLLDLFQLLLDLPNLDSVFRSPFLNAMLRLSSRSSLYPTHLLQKQVSFEGADPIAAGQFGDVWKGQYLGHQVAVKVLKLYANSDLIKHKKKVLHETLIWRQLHHTNVLPFLCLHHLNNNETRLGLVSPWMEHGNLKDYLSRNADADRVSLLRDVAEGLEYLHIMQPSVVHGDLKAVNILISELHRAQLADFGLSTASDSQALMLSSFSLGPNGGTPRWMAPELLDGRQEVNNTQTDVYAFACVCYEIFAGTFPFANLNDYPVMVRVMQGQRPLRPIQCQNWKTPCVELGSSDGLWQLIERCWASSADERPSMSWVVEKLPAKEPPSSTGAVQRPSLGHEAPGDELWPGQDLVPWAGGF